MITKTCEICGSEFQVKPYRANTARFCSQKCGGKWHMSVRKMPDDHKHGNKWRVGKRPTHSFSKGNTPWNKGMRGTHFSPGTEFKPGRKSNKWLPVGSERIRRDKSGRERVHVKIAEPNIWKLRAVHVWETENGTVPRGSVVHHIDRDSLNDAISNLIVMTRAAHIAEHRRELQNA